jgi:hypothetical protein
MEEEKYQKELFEFEQPKRSFSRLSEMLPKADFEGRVAITISLEKLVFISIGIMMVLVVVYALGVESGKSRANAPAVQAVKPLPAPPISQVQQNRVATIPAKNILNTAPIVPAAKGMAPARQAIQDQAKAMALGKASKPFTILAGTFTKRGNAEAASAALTKQGLNAVVTYSQFYYRVCVGAYSNGVEAERDLSRVKSIYKDAVLKPK